MDVFEYIHDDNEEISNEKYNEMTKIIKKDFQRLIYLYEKYENNEELIDEFKKTIENISNYKKGSLDISSKIILLNEYLYFNYINTNDSQACDKLDFVTVVMNRNAKEFYFVYRFNPSIGTIIKRFNIKNNKINYIKYKDKFTSQLFIDDINLFINNDIFKLKYLPKIN